MAKIRNGSGDREKCSQHSRSKRRQLGVAGLSVVLGFMSGAALGQQQPSTKAEKGAKARPEQNVPQLKLQQVVVTGTMIRGVAPVGSSLITVGRQAIAETGAQTMQQILASVPAITSFGSAAQGSQGSFDPSGAFAPTIHGMGASASNGTLVLIDGHRLPLSGISHNLGDPNIIAPLMVQRVEVLPDGASSTYGSDAVAGVINVITRSHFKGLEATGQYSFASGWNTENGGLLWGDEFDNTNVMASLNFERRSALGVSQRSFTKPNHTAQGGHNFGSFQCGPASVEVGGNFYLYPYTNGPTAIAPCETTRTNEAPIADLLPAESRTDAMVKITHAVGEDFIASGDLVYSNEYYHQALGRGGVNATVYGPGSTPPGGAGQINPFFQGPPGATSETVEFNGDNLLGPGAAQTGGIKTLMGDVRLTWQLPHDWEAVLASTVGQTHNTYDVNGTLCASCAYLALNGTTNSAGNPLTPSISGTTTTITDLPLTPSNALNVWSPTSAGTSAQVLRNLTNSATIENSTQTLKDVSVKFNGNVVATAAGEIKAAAGVEYAHYGITQHIIQPNNTGPATLGSIANTYDWGRDVKSVFAEVLIPVFGKDRQEPLLKELTFDISGRIDDYSDFGSTKNPRFAVNWKPTNDLTVRANYSRSFTAPALASIGDNGVTAESGYTDVSSVRSLSLPNTFPGAIGLPGCTSATPTCTIGTSTVTGFQVNGPNSRLKPETGKSWSVSLTWTPRSIHGLLVNASYWNIQYSGLITAPQPTFAVSSPSLSPLLTLYPNGATPAQIAAIVGSRPQTGPVPSKVYWIYNFEQQNALNLKVDGIDGSVSYERPTSLGTFSAQFSESLKLKAQQQFGSGGTWFSVLNVSGFNTTFPTYRFLGRLDLGWARWGLNVHFITDYLGSYLNWNGAAPYPLIRNASFAPIGGGQSVSSLATFNLFAGYTFRRNSDLAGLGVSLTINNIANEDPPFFNSPLGYDNLGSGNPIGRTVTLSLHKMWE